MQKFAIAVAIAFAFTSVTKADTDEDRAREIAKEELDKAGRICPDCPNATKATQKKPGPKHKKQKSTAPAAPAPQAAAVPEVRTVPGQVTEVPVPQVKVVPQTVEVPVPQIVVKPTPVEVPAPTAQPAPAPAPFPRPTIPPSLGGPASAESEFWWGPVLGYKLGGPFAGAMFNYKPGDAPTFRLTTALMYFPLDHVSLVRGNTVVQRDVTGAERGLVKLSVPIFENKWGNHQLSLGPQVATVFWVSPSRVADVEGGVEASTLWNKKFFLAADLGYNFVDTERKLSAGKTEGLVPPLVFTITGGLKL